MTSHGSPTPETSPVSFFNSTRLHLNRAMLLVIDIQDAFAPHIHEMDRVIQRSGIAIQAANTLDLPIVVTEQYPTGLGHTVEPIRKHLGQLTPLAKTAFSVLGDPTAQQAILDTGRTEVLIVGIETHVCINQTALDLFEMGLRPVILTDAVSSRRPHDHTTALARLASAATITTTEAALLEMLGHSKHPAFKDISRLIR